MWCGRGVDVGLRVFEFGVSLGVSTFAVVLCQVEAFVTATSQFWSAINVEHVRFMEMYLNHNNGVKELVVEFGRMMILIKFYNKWRFFMLILL